MPGHWLIRYFILYQLLSSNFQFIVHFGIINISTNFNVSNIFVKRYCKILSNFCNVLMRMNTRNIVLHFPNNLSTNKKIVKNYPRHNV